MTQPISALRVPAIDPIQGPRSVQKAGHGFMQTLNNALDQVSSAQKASGAADKALITGAPGASLEKAVVADARAKIDWNATVAVRNEVENAYNTIMNMQV